MSRPASLPPQRPFIGKNNKAGSKKIELNLDQAEERQYGSHRLTADIHLETLGRLRRELRDAEERGLKKAHKIRREINATLEAGLYTQGTFCPSCGLHLHRCKCPSLRKITLRTKKKIEAKAQREAAVTAIIHDILNRKR